MKEFRTESCDFTKKNNRSLSMSKNASLVCNRRDQVKQAVGLCRKSLFLVFFYHKMAVIWHFLSNFEVFVFKTSIGESECDAEGGASNFFCQNFYSENSPFTTYFFVKSPVPFTASPCLTWSLGLSANRVWLKWPT